MEIKQEFKKAVLDFAEEMIDIDQDIFDLLSQSMLSELIKSLQNPSTRADLMEAYIKEGENVSDMVDGLSEALNELRSEGHDGARIDFIQNFFTLIFGAYDDIAKYGISATRMYVETCRKRDGIPMPKYMNKGDSGIDVYALEEYSIAPGETKLVPTGIKISIPEGYEVQVRDKSGIALKTKLRVANAPGTIDSSYRGEICVIMENIEAPIKDISYEFKEDGQIDAATLSILHGRTFVIDKGQRFAQLVLLKIETAIISEMDFINIEDTDRSEGGFGSTGLN